MPEQPVFDFAYDPSVAEFAVSNEDYLASRPEVSFKHIATGVLALHMNDPSGPKILLLQRSADDSYPCRWEPPGGACDDEDESILHGAARELWEEAGLHVAHFDGLLGEPHLFTFIVRLRSDGETVPAVKLDPKEHQNYVWATEDEVKAGKVDGIELQFTTAAVKRTVLETFDLGKRKPERDERSTFG